jgi:hypothetical protein
MFGWLKKLFGGGGGGGGAEMRRLVALARGDAGRAERLVDYELKRDPSLSRAEAIRSAIDRLEYDRTR